MNMTNPGEVARLSLGIGKRLKKLRMERGLTQKRLAAKIEGGVDYTYIGKIERDEQFPSLKILQRISEAFTVPIYYFFRDEPDSVVYVNCSAELGDLIRDEKGRELFKALTLLDAGDIPLIIEIIKMLTKHRAIEKPGDLKERGPATDDFLSPAKKDSLFLKK
jgi:transcriptional regulator with XRE-family HTH domain